MSDDWPARFTAEALAKVDAFTAEHPEYSREGVAQPGQGSTNRVVFARRGKDMVVFKVFCEQERKQRECFGLRHWRDTGLVPQLLCDADHRMIVMSHVPGEYLRVAPKGDGDTVWARAWHETGRAMGLLTRVPLSGADRASFESRFYADVPTLDAYLERIVELGRGICSRDPDFMDDFWGRSLDFMQAELAGLLTEPRVLYHQDVANFHVRQGRFEGFFDVEMCRVGCASMQLASAMALLAGEPSAWEPFRRGWENATGCRLEPAQCRATAAGRHFLCWREISRYLSYDGTPGTGFAWCDPADPAPYRKSIEVMASMLGLKR